MPFEAILITTWLSKVTSINRAPFHQIWGQLSTPPPPSAISEVIPMACLPPLLNYKLWGGRIIGYLASPEWGLPPQKCSQSQFGPIYADSFGFKRLWIANSLPNTFLAGLHIFGTVYLHVPSHQISCKMRGHSRSSPIVPTQLKDSFERVFKTRYYRKTDNSP